MVGKIAAFFGGLFSSSRMQDTAVDALRKMGGLDDLNPKEKADFLLKYIEATRHQSATRRFIALTLTLTFCLFVGTWWIAAAVGHLFAIEAALMLAIAAKGFFLEIVFAPFNIILSFYFVMNIADRVGKK